MKKSQILSFFIFLLLMLNSCKEDKKSFNIDLPEKKITFEYYDVNADFYNDSISLIDFKNKYPNFFTVSDSEIEKFRTDPLEKKIYFEIQKKINHEKIKTELNTLFLHIQHYFPKFKIPKIYVYSSVLQAYQEPIIYNQEKNTILILADSFLGDKNELYKEFRIEAYFQKIMSQEYIIPKISLAISETIIPFDATKQEFLNHLVFNGKLMLLQDAFLPNYEDYLKIGMTKNQFDWCKENEYYIWSYFIDNELVFSNDSQLLERFINFGPFSKFYLEIDQDSPSGVGIFIGWKIMKNYYQNEDTTLQKTLLNQNYQEIFQKSNFKPENKLKI